MLMLNNTAAAVTSSVIALLPESGTSGTVGTLGVGTRVVVRFISRGLATHPRGHADAILRDGLRHGFWTQPPAPHRCERRRAGDRRFASTDASARRVAGPFRLRKTAKAQDR